MKTVSKVFWKVSDSKEMNEIFSLNILTTRKWFSMVCSLIDNGNRHHSSHNSDVK